MGKVELHHNAGLVNVIAGTFNETKGTANTYSPVNLFDIELKKGAEVNFVTPATHNTAMLVIDGSADVNDQKAAEYDVTNYQTRYKILNSSTPSLPLQA
jgi:redox-sensitive bicupin YhaK (pirin superfamily)